MAKEKEQVMGEKQKIRNYGIDLLRICAMYGIVVIHILGDGGVLSVGTSGNKQAVASVLRIVFVCAVNCYAIISGYVSYSEHEKSYRYNKYVNIWLSVFWYSFGIAFAGFLVNPELVSWKALFASAIPVTAERYWYFTAYTFLFFLIPWINKGMRNLTNKEATMLTMTLLILCSFYPMLHMNGNTFFLHEGYSALWLCVLYVVGAWMKKTQILKLFSSNWLILAEVCCVLIATFIYLFDIFWGGVLKSFIVAYISPTVVISAIVLVELFSRITCSKPMERFIQFGAPATFGVYIIHEHWLLKKYFIANKFLWILEQPIYMLPILVLGCALIIFVGCLLIEKIRISMFSLLNINKIVDCLCEKIKEQAKKQFP